ncbi:hypothetical protein I307_00141 [Cryptococcus deuterogattii 99/473]|uniref:Uncharacterized protein n=2 Tax=Cryptococcus deuterogattii TaxID=1859096 RepID=A0A0D0TCE8_9TREE|nr:hypothetical protein CNBG_3088 [Cryptococcus deuterogattii R265]KIR30064.1 hypothetical protein I309_00932 [Cryptococcus deuterogattii LA55]KIR37349.1 hypothetical protein I352_00664 [Cryptococcus deuterogattii MMRL2647]KIR43817.1 hypothetical protein I313_00662 [Cryptococcus deuterogattii Ram5]KIR75149.1 hypothetical protein I310_01426 [Cryptococcus deuterogattii CA1014]KIR92818.1 hypothetical protein I304_03398 [Cryptococcus deuterogattii CBS 10090]KIR98140.1 hypothetical protein L804_04
MSGFVLGTGSGVLTAAAVYYTLSAHLTQTTASLRSDLHSSTNLLNASFDPTTPPAQAALIGPSSISPSPPSFSQVLRQRWNDTLASFVGSVRQSDWELIGKEVVEVGRSVVDRLGEGESTGQVVQKGEKLADVLKERALTVVDQAKNVGTSVDNGTESIKKAAEGIDLHKDNVGIVGGPREEIKNRVVEAKGRLV